MTGPVNPEPPNPFSVPPPDAYGAVPVPNAYGAVPPAKKGGRGKVIGIVVGVVVLLLVVCGALAIPRIMNAVKSDSANAKVGDCLQSDKLDSTNAKPVGNVKIVDCSADSATYKVVGIVPNKTRSDFNSDDKICNDFASATSALWQGTGEVGSVLCLEATKK